MKKNRKNSKNKKGIFYKVLSILLLLNSLGFLGVLLYIDLLPTKYLIIITIVIAVINVICVPFLNFKRLKKKPKNIISVFSIILILLFSIANFYICRTLGVLSGNGDSKYKLEHYSIIVLKDSKYDKLKDIEGETVGFFENSKGSEEAKKRLSKMVIVDYKAYKNSDSLVEDLLNKKINVIMIEDSIKKLVEEEHSDFSSLTKELTRFTVKVKVESTLKDVKVTKEPFAIYISGIDTYGEISSVSRSDVNIVMLVNPSTKQVLLISIPRDYYVQLHGTTGVKDKLTHAGIYGIDMSVKTLEDLLDTKINYYIKVNFTSVIDIVNALGGVDIYSEYTFVSYSGYSFKAGMNKVDGEEALDFVRTRKAFADGDRQRGKNQQALIEALIRKATDKSIITKYNSLLSAIDGKYQTNMSIKKITALIKMQLNDMPKWNVTSYSLSGTDSSNYTYTYNQLLYVMEPDNESVESAKNLINSVLRGNVLDSTYNNISDESNSVKKVNSNQANNNSTPKQEVKQASKEIEKIEEEKNENDNLNNDDKTDESKTETSKLEDDDQKKEQDEKESKVDDFENVINK